MNNRPGARPSLRDLQRLLLDGQYRKTMEIANVTFGREFTADGILGKRLADIEAKARALEAAGKRMTLQTPEIAAFLADYERSLRRHAALLDALAEPLQSTGINAGLTIAEQTALAGLTNTVWAARWKRPGADTLRSVLNYVQKPGFKAQLGNYPDSVMTIVKGLIQGRNPVAIAAELRKSAPSLAAYKANSLMRTLQLTAYRDSTALSYLANADILEPYAIRISALQIGRTCLACVALHGTKIPLGQRVDDHENGLCTSIPVIRGRAANVQDGVSWFGGLTPDQQRKMAGPSAYEAITRGDATLPDFVGKRVDPIFGPMVYEQSLKGLFGPAAQDYYKQAREARA